MTLGPLTKRESEVVLLIADGHRQESISNQLGISIETVKVHVYNICGKLRANSTLEVVTWYYKEYWQPKQFSG
jgi:NarL family two-component system response regulator LiaR